jgi:REP element-mobilizing transposase RayT
MRHDKIEIYIHLIWTTWDREPFITPELEADIFPIMCEIVERHGAKILAVNGVADHVHLLVKFASITRLCDLVKDVKGVTSRTLNERNVPFKWRPTYAAFSVSRWNVRSLIGYIERQKEHHARGTTVEMLESDGEEYDDSE